MQRRTSGMINGGGKGGSKQCTLIISQGLCGTQYTIERCFSVLGSHKGSDLAGDLGLPNFRQCGVDVKPFEGFGECEVVLGVERSRKEREKQVLRVGA